MCLHAGGEHRSETRFRYRWQIPDASISKTARHPSSAEDSPHKAPGASKRGPAGLSVLLRRSQCFQGGNRSVSRTRRLAALWNYFSREPEAASRNNGVSRNGGQKRCPIRRTLRSGSLGWGCILEHIQACLGSRGRLDRVCSGVSATWFEGTVHRFVQPIVSKVGCVWRQWKQAKAAVELCHALSCQNAQISVIDTGGLANVACN